MRPVAIWCLVVYLLPISNQYLRNLKTKNVWDDDVEFMCRNGMLLVF